MKPSVSIVMILYKILFVQLLLSIATTTVRFSLAQTDDGVNVTKQVIKDYLSNQVMSNVFLNMDTILNAATTAVAKVNAVRDNRIFQYGMTAPDRELIFGVLTPGFLDQGVNMYVGLDDGTYFGSGAGLVTYREPGNAYSIEDIQPDDPNYKYFDVCVDSYDGYPLNCTMQDENKTYVECVDNCDPVPCNTSMNDDEDSNVTLMCRNYVTKVVDANNVGMLGYVPSTTYCVNQYNQIETTPGLVVFSYGADFRPNAFTSCYYFDYNTTVNRTTSGEYAFCGPNKTCDTTYQGGFFDQDYDPRLRPWFIETKAAQKPTWTAPILGTRGTHLAITYNQPIYTTQISNDTEEIQLFEGVIGMAYDLSTISKFLKTSQYGSAGRKVFVVEDKEPYFLIGTSIEQFTTNNTVTIGNVTYNNTEEWTTVVGVVSDGITKFVLNTNESEYCPYVNASNPYEFQTDDPDVLNNCTTIRVPMQEFFDIISYRAFQEYNKTNFDPKNEGIYFRENNAVLNTPAYIAYASLYTKENLNWHVFVVSPVPRSTTDALLKGNVMFTVICIVATIGFLTCFSMFYCFYARRTEKAVIHADWRFTCAFILGCACVNFSSYTLLGENTNQLCMLRMWSFNGLFVSALSPLFVKVWRMAKLMNASLGFRRTIVTNFQAWVLTLPLVFLELILLMIASIIDPPHQSEEHVGEGLGYQVMQCTQNSNAFFIVQTIFHGTLVLAGCVLAYRTRDLDPKYGEAKQLAFSMYNIALTGLIAILVISLVDLDQVSLIVVQTVSVLWGSCFCSLAFVLPRLLQVQKDHKLAASGSTLKSKSFAGGNGFKISGLTSNASFATSHKSFTNIESTAGYQNVSVMSLALSNHDRSNRDTDDEHAIAEVTGLNTESKDPDQEEISNEDNTINDPDKEEISNEDDKMYRAVVADSYAQIMGSVAESALDDGKDASSVNTFDTVSGTAGNESETVGGNTIETESDEVKNAENEAGSSLNNNKNDASSPKGDEVEAK